MSILTRSSNDIIGLIKRNIALFSSFEHVYLFGSALVPGIPCNDIDILTIYAEYSAKIDNELRAISEEIEKASGMRVDMTSLSIEEETDIGFLDKIKPRIFKIK